MQSGGATRCASSPPLPAPPLRPHPPTPPPSPDPVTRPHPCLQHELIQISQRPAGWTYPGGIPDFGDHVDGKCGTHFSLLVGTVLQGTPHTHAQGGNAGQFRLIAGSHLLIARAMRELAGGFTQAARARVVTNHVQMARDGLLGMHTHLDMRPGQWLLVHVSQVR